MCVYVYMKYPYEFLHMCICGNKLTSQYPSPGQLWFLNVDCVPLNWLFNLLMALSLNLDKQDYLRNPYRKDRGSLLVLQPWWVERPNQVSCLLVCQALGTISYVIFFLELTVFSWTNPALTWNNIPDNIFSKLLPDISLPLQSLAYSTCSIKVCF